MILEDLLPPTIVGILVATFTICRFENQRWVRAMQRGLRGRSEVVQFFVSGSGFFALFFGLAFVISYAVQHGIVAALGIFLAGFIPTLIWGAVVRDGWVVWGVATLALWPLMISLFFLTNWFGLLA